MRSLWLLIGWFSFNSSKARTKITQEGGRGEDPGSETWMEVHAAPVEPSVPVPPLPDVEASPTAGEMERGKVEAEKLEEVGRLPLSSPTQQLAQMAAEAKPSMSGGEELAKKKP